MRISDWSSDVCSSDLHVVDQAMFVDDADRVELRLEFGLEHFFEQILEAAVIGLEDRVLGRQIHRPLAREAIVEAGACEVADRIVEIVHAHRDARRGELEHLLVDPRAVLAFEHHRSEEHTSELQSLMRTSYAVLCLKKKNK